MFLKKLRLAVLMLVAAGTMTVGLSGCIIVVVTGADELAEQIEEAIEHHGEEHGEHHGDEHDGEAHGDADH